MVRLFFSLLICAVYIQAYAGSKRYDSNHILFWDEVSHLRYMLNTDTKEAMLGDGLDEEKNALQYPSADDDWWNNQTNLWEHVVVADSIVFDNETYAVTSVAANAFYKSTEVKTIKLPNTIKEIGSYAFGYCTNLNSLNIPEGVKVINVGMFYVCKNLTSVQLPSTVESIGNQAFMDCVLLEKINIPGNCRNVGNDAFSWCVALRTLTIEDGVVPLKLGYAYDFGPMWQTNMEPYYYASKFYRGLFNDCPLKNLYVGRNLEYDNVGKLQSPFEFCTVKTDSNGKPIYLRNGKYYNEVKFGNMVSEIHSYLFNNAQLSEIVLPDSLIMIGERAFYNAITQSCIAIPEKCDSIGDYAFASTNLSGPLKNIYSNALVPPHIGSFSFDKQNIMVSVPKGTRNSYKADKYWKKYIIYDLNDEIIDINLKYANSLYGRLSFMDLNPTDVSRLKVSGTLGEDDWKTISSMANLFDLDLSEVTSSELSSISGVLSHLVKLKFPKGLKVIEKGQFEGCHLSGSVEIPESCERIGFGAFSGAPINKLVIKGPAVVEESAFSFCTALKEIVISGGARLLEGSFKYIMDTNNPNAGLEILTLGNDVVVNKDAFYYCKHLTNICFDGKIDSVANGAFNSCKNIKNIVFNGSVRNLGSEVFKEMSIFRLDINDVQSWCSMSFDSKLSNPISQAEEVYINGSKELDLVLSEDINVIGNNVFATCKSLRSLIVEGNVKTIGDYSFSFCQNLKKVSVSNDVESIGNGAFEGCSSLYSIQLPVGLPSISDSLFYGCDNLRKIKLPSTVRAINKSAFEGCKSIESIDIPHTCEEIGENAFNGCLSLMAINIPYNIYAIGELAFANCGALKTVQTFWENPPRIVPTAFTNINKKCILNVPVGSVPNYYQNGWGRFPLIEEGFCVLYINGNQYGSIDCDGGNLMTFSNIIALHINSDVTLTVKPDYGFYIKTLSFDEEQIVPGAYLNKIEMNNVNSNHTLSVDYRRYVMGDVNDDNYVDVGDISSVVRHIQKKTDDNFIAIAADVNQDNEIDVGDIRGIVNLIYNYVNSEKNYCTLAKRHATSDYIDMERVKTEKFNECLFNISLRNVNDVSGFQMNIILPKIITETLGKEAVTEVVFNERSTANMNIKDITMLNDTCIQVLCASTKPNELVDGENIVSLKITAPAIILSQLDQILVSDIRVANRNASVEYGDDYIYTFNNSPTNIDSAYKIIEDRARKKYIKDGQIMIDGPDGTYNVIGVKQR